MSAKVIRFPKQFVPPIERKAQRLVDRLEMFLQAVEAGDPPPEDERGRRGYELAQRILGCIAAAPERRK